MVMLYNVGELGTIHFIICNTTEEDEHRLHHPGQTTGQHDTTNTDTDTPGAGAGKGKGEEG
jgi:hypothetical protein